MTQLELELRQTGLLVDHSKQDGERAEALVTVLCDRVNAHAWRNEYDQPLTMRQWLEAMEPFVVEVFKAVRGEL